MSDQYIQRIKKRIDEAMDKHAHAAMLASPANLLSVGEITGTYRGLKQALDIIGDVLREGQLDEDQS